MACRECIKEIGLPEGTVAITPEGVVAQIGKSGRVDPSTVRKASGLGAPRLSEIGKLLFEMPSSDEGGGSQNYSRIDLV